MVDRLQEVTADTDWNLGILTIEETKAGGPRRIPLNSEAQRVLSELHVAHPPLAGGQNFPA